MPPGFFCTKNSGRIKKTNNLKFLRHFIESRVIIFFMSDTENTGRVRPVERTTGASIPLGAIYTKKNTVIGEYTVLPEFAKFCKKSGIGLIQLLPVNDTGTQSSPYSGLSAFALHPIYIDISALPEFKAVYEADAAFKKEYDAFIKNNPYNGRTRYNYDAILNAKDSLLRKIYAATDIAKDLKPSDELGKWIKKNPWIVNYAVYKGLKYKYNQASWKEWNEKDKNLSEKEILSRYNAKANQKEMLFYAWEQMRAASQFKKSCDAVKKSGIIIKGDMPILMNEDSCDAWALPGIFNQNLRAGSPVDNENPTGQNWGFPTYNWKYLKEHDYSWWKDRLKSAEQYYEAYRLDHILGFFRIWAIPTRDTTAILGHTDPYISISRDTLHNAGFDDNRIRWLSQPHVPTGAIQDITWNYESATKILSKFADRLGNEELWLFKKDVQGDKDFYEADLSEFCEGDAQSRVKQTLSRYWNDRCLLEIEENQFLPIWTYYQTTSWNSLNDGEKNTLKWLIENAENEQNRLWETQSDEILSALTNSVSMVPCGEDLGADLPCLPSVMDRNGILSLRVYRWCRRWKEGGQPFVQFADLPALSVCTTSVHDSSTLRQWWNDEKEAANVFAHTYPWAFGLEGWDNDGINAIAYSPYNEKIALGILKALSNANSLWCIHPMQDFLSLESAYWLENPDEERINIPGTVSQFNWTYRLPVLMEDLLKNESLIEKIKEITSLHGGK